MELARPFLWLQRRIVPVDPAVFRRAAESLPLECRKAPPPLHAVQPASPIDFARFVVDAALDAEVDEYKKQRTRLTEEAKLQKIRDTVRRELQDQSPNGGVVPAAAAVEEEIKRRSVAAATSHKGTLNGWDKAPFDSNSGSWNAKRIDFECEPRGGLTLSWSGSVDGDTRATIIKPPPHKCSGNGNEKCPRYGVFMSAPSCLCVTVEKTSGHNGVRQTGILKLLLHDAPTNGDVVGAFSKQLRDQSCQIQE